MRRFATGIAGLDALGQHDLFVLGQERVATRLPQEQVEAVRRRDLDLDDLDALLWSRRVDDVDAELRQLVAQHLNVVGFEVEFEGEPGQLILVDKTPLLSKLHQEPGFRLDDELVSHSSSTPQDSQVILIRRLVNVRRAQAIPTRRYLYATALGSGLAPLAWIRRSDDPHRRRRSRRPVPTPPTWRTFVRNNDRS